MSGWIKLHRSILDFEWYEDANTMRTFLHLLLSANHKPRKWKGTVVERGQVITSRDHLATDLKLSVQQIRTALSKLEKSENITIKSTKRFTAITVCNYGTYQSEEVDSNQQSNPPATNNQPTDNQQVTTNKNVRIKECKNDKNSVSPTASEIDFDQFWSVYPKKTGKQTARKAWNSKANKSKPDIEAIIAAVNSAKESPQWTDNSGRFIPNPSTWLNRHGWEDEADTEKATGSYYDQNKVF